ncbi:MAG TPA: glycosyltransferase family 4 protein [Acidobacteriota bacterium]|nr:glycosyltransferase family 4 protein [Acidobacteriota bacterium]
MKSLHIVFFNRSYYPDTAATGQLLTELCEGLAANHGCRVSVVAGIPLNSSATGCPDRSNRGFFFDREEKNGVQILRAKGTSFSKKRFLGRATNYITYFISACVAGQRLRDPDTVVALTDPPIIGVAAWLSSVRYRVPFVMSFRDVFPEVARLLEEFQSEFINGILQRVNRFLVRRAVKIVALGESMREKLIRGKGADPGKIVIIPDWADCTQIVPGSKENAFTREHGLSGKFVVMHSGNLGLSQSLNSVLESAKFLQDYPDIAMVFVGEGVKKAELQERARDLGLQQVLFLPFQPKERLSESFASADVFAISLLPGMSGYIVPSKLYGILAAGRPYVAVVEQESEAVQIALANDCGLVAIPGDPKNFSEQIVALYNDRGRTRRMGQNARRVAESRFDLAPNVRTYYELFASITSHAVKPSPSRLNEGVQTSSPAEAKTPRL